MPLIRSSVSAVRAIRGRFLDQRDAFIDRLVEIEEYGRCLNGGDLVLRMRDGHRQISLVGTAFRRRSEEKIEPDRAPRLLPYRSRLD